MPGLPAAKLGDQVLGTDIHIVLVPGVPSPVPTPLPHPFIGFITGGCSSNVNIMGMPAATLGSTATGNPPHIPLGGGPFSKPPTNQATILKGSATVFINNKPAARMGDTVLTCNDPVDLPMGTVLAVGTVFLGG
ncbi:MAG TPA: PAAR domain-containing protein [Chloroflexota bacterium]|nr:PAAR domain-containing protein [Chloroflexota bacterium]